MKGRGYFRLDAVGRVTCVLSGADQHADLSGVTCRRSDLTASHAVRKQVVAGPILGARFLVFSIFRSVGARFSFLSCCKNDKQPRLKRSFIDGHENCRNPVSIQFLMFFLQAREHATQHCDTVIVK